MGLASALSTALTGLTAAETTIDVIGNNLANSNTVGFKSSSAAFATQFLRTQSLGSGPTSTSGGTNPRQIGLGTMVAEITPDFNQGTIEISSNPTDLAIQGEGFYIVEGKAGEELYTRNGIFKMNAANEMVTITGNRLLGYAVDDQYNLIPGSLQSLDIPLGAAVVAKPTSSVDLEGTLTPTGDLATTAEIIKSGILGEGNYTYPTTQPTITLAPTPVVTGSSATAQNAAGTLATGSTYDYRVVFADSAYGGDPNTEALLSADISPQINLAGPNNQIFLDGIPNHADYSYFRIYRSTDSGAYNYIGEVDYSAGPVADFTDTGIADGAAYSTTSLSGKYSYYVTFADAAGGPGFGSESRPSAITEAPTIVNGRLHLTSLPTDSSGDWVVRRIYRNTDADDDTFYFVGEVGGDGSGGTDPTSYSDSVSDATIVAGGNTIDLDGPKISNSTLLTDVTLRDGVTYSKPFTAGTLGFTGRKGGRLLQEKEMVITATTTVLELINFMEQSLGIVKSSVDVANPIPDDITGENPGGSIDGGMIMMVGNNGVDNAINIGLSAMQITSGGTAETVTMPFHSTQTAVGESAVADFLAYDSLGMPLSVRLTMVMEAKTSNSMSFRWFADSPNNAETTGVDISVGTGVVTFDGEGNFVSASDNTVSIGRADQPSASPLQFEIDFAQISGLAAENSSLAISRQDGSAPGVLTSFIVGEDGSISGVFSNGISRTRGQIRLARFGNPAGLEQKGENLYSGGANSGLAVEGNP
ncbi:MAG: flagellar hook-basal body complex protein, partial [Thermoguttaceae bacterium]